jgi:hypothetical protein
MKILHIPLQTPHDFQYEIISWCLRGLCKTHKLEIDKLFYTEKLFKKHFTCNNIVKYLLEHYD